MSEAEQRTQVAIVGAGPAGLTLGRLLERHGIDTVILEARSREHCEGRIRAGVLEQSACATLIEAGVGDRILREGIVHDGIYLQLEGERHRLPIHHLTDRSVTIYGQTEVVKDLIAARLHAGAPLLFDAREVQIEGLHAGLPRVYYRHEGAERVLNADFIVGCDGFHGICRPSFPAGAQKVWQHEYPFAWLGILADVEPSTDELIYARHHKGFALHSMRSRSVSRLYIQVSPSDDVAAWSDDRIWDQLHERLATDGWSLKEGPITERSILPMRSFVAAPMRAGALFLAGDAAHIVPPTGAKGLNLALADVARLAPALADALRPGGSHAGIDEYSVHCLERVWRAQNFAWTMTMMLHNDPSGDAFGDQLARSQLRYVFKSPAAATSVAENYVGLPC